MTECYQETIPFPPVKRRRVEAEFRGGDITSDGGAQLLRLVDQRLGLTDAIARCMPDTRRQASCQHSMLELIRQRTYGLALGYEDLNDHDRLRSDIGFQAALSRVEPLASSPTLCRMEHTVGRDTAVAMHEVFIQQFINSHSKAPRRLILDFDATDAPVHGEQEGRFFHGYYDHYCFLPLYVFCGRQLLVSYLRPSNIDPARHTWAILALLVKRLRAVWPKVQIMLRADSGFCRWRILRWCDRHNVKYLVGIAKNPRLNAVSLTWTDRAKQAFETTGRKQRLFGTVNYAAGTWDCQRRVIVKAEHSRLGANPRYVVTNLTANPKYLYDKLYCMRGDMENRIKDQQLGLFADRVSAHHWWPNQLRVLLSGVAYCLFEGLRSLALSNTPLARSSIQTIRITLLKIGAVILRNTRRIRLMLSSAYPHQELFARVAARLNTS